MYSQAELDKHLAAFTAAWLDYKAWYHQTGFQLEELEATARCNREIAWLYDHHLRLFVDVVWQPSITAFVLTEAIVP